MPDTTPPSFVEAALNQAGDKITITFNEELDDTSVPANGDFTVTVNGVVRSGAVSGVQIDGATVVLTLTPALAATDEVQVGYSPGTNKLRDSSPAQNNEITTTLASYSRSPRPSRWSPRSTLLNTPADGQTFKLGEVIKVRVTFSEPVTASGVPQLTVHSDDGWMRVQARGLVQGPGPYTIDGIPARRAGRGPGHRQARLRHPRQDTAAASAWWAAAPSPARRTSPSAPSRWTRCRSPSRPTAARPPATPTRATSPTVPAAATSAWGPGSTTTTAPWAPSGAWAARQGTKPDATPSTSPSPSAPRPGCASTPRAARPSPS